MNEERRAHLIELRMRDIRQALTDYTSHCNGRYLLPSVSDAFVRKLATDNVTEKEALYDLFERSEGWNEELGAVVINGSRTHEPDSTRISTLGQQILNLHGFYSSRNWEMQTNMDNMLHFFSNQSDMTDDERERDLAAIAALSPRAYAPGKKLSRVFKAVCVSLGIADESAGSEFQRLFAQFADELITKQINYKLFMSLNPAHFLTMSNPRGDSRGETLVSCHSFNSGSYRNGCMGYARDNNSIIVFTTANPDDPETLNNRKTLRQIFAYQPGNGLLLQSRLYKTSGGTYGEQAESKEYRMLIQNEIAAMENEANRWKTKKVCGGNESAIIKGRGYGGYADWQYSDFNAKISILKSKLYNFQPITVGAAGLCIGCGRPTSSGFYCGNGQCDGNMLTCGMCGGGCRELHRVVNANGETVEICNDCLSRNYTRCECCGEYRLSGEVSAMRGYGNICNSCRETNFATCDHCHRQTRRTNLTEVTNIRGERVCVCRDCREENYTYCDICGNYHADDIMVRTGDNRNVCAGCLADRYTACGRCRRFYPTWTMTELEDGTRICANCSESEETA